jgi:hypothetical protein
MSTEYNMAALINRNKINVTFVNNDIVVNSVTPFDTCIHKSSPGMSPYELCGPPVG